MTPLFEQDGFIVCFEAEPEQGVSMRTHFVKECGWTPAQYRSISKFAWFSAKVSVWKDGVERGVSCLGCCCYKTVAEFYTRYKGDYFADMVKDALSEASTFKGESK